MASCVSVGVSPFACEPWCDQVDVVATALDPDFNIIWCNDHLKKMLGVSPSPDHRIPITHLVPQEILDDRRRLLSPLLAAADVVRYIDLIEGVRWLVTGFRLDPDALGSPGAFVVCEVRTVRGFEDDRWPIARVFSGLHLGPLTHLTRRELELLWLVARGLSDKEIAARADRTKNTIETHVSSMLRKLGVPTRVVLARTMAERGLTAFSEAEWAGIVAGVYG